MSTEVPPITLYRTRRVATDKLVPYARNARTHSDEQVAQIAASMVEFGFTNPVLIDENGGIIAGHGRVLAALDLQIPKVPCVVLTGLSDAQRRAYVLADNKLALNAGWDMEMLAAELQGLSAIDFDTSLVGFTGADLQSLLEIDEPENPAAPPAATSEPVTRPGDLWLLGNHRVLCGDATSKSDMTRLCSGVRIDCVLFDPPYDEVELYNHIPPPGTCSKLLVFWDFKRFAIAPAKALKAGWTAQYEFVWDCVQSWYTPNRPLQRHKSCGYFCDDPYFNTDLSLVHDGKERESKAVANTRGAYDYQALHGAKHIATVESFSNTAESDGHGHGKPVPWIKAIIQGVGGEVFLSMFGGSGADTIACEMAGKRSVVMEIDCGHVDGIVERWQAQSGQLALHEKTSKSFDAMRRARGVLKREKTNG